VRASCRSLVLACVALYLLVVAVVWFAIRHADGGHFIYALDDAYIHLALAENIARGHYGINAIEASSPSSSILWPFLLVPFAGKAWHIYVPLFWNVLFGIAATCLIAGAIHRWPPQADENGRMAWGKQLLTALFVMLTANLASLTFLGMEHVLQVLIAICCAFGMMEALSGRRIPNWCIAAAVIGPAVRYEDLSLTVAIGLALWGLGERKKAGAVIALSLIPLIGFSLFLRNHQLPMLPTSVMVKGGVYSTHASLAHRLVRLVGGDLNQAITKSARWPVLVLFLVFVPIFWQERVKARRYVFAGVLLVGIMHLALGRFGWFFRYEVYALILLTMILLRVLAEQPRFLFGYFVLGLVFCAAPYIAALHATVTATHDVYGQQYQMHRFANDFYGHDFAVNDLGMVSYQKPLGTYVLDVFGLASPEASRQVSKTPEWLDGIVKRHGVKLAMLYPEWFDIPLNWIPVAKMCLDKTPMINDEQCMVFYSTSAEAEPEIRADLMRFEPTLPKRVVFRFDPERREGGYPMPPPHHK